MAQPLTPQTPATTAASTSGGRPSGAPTTAPPKGPSGSDPIESASAFFLKHQRTLTFAGIGLAIAIALGAGIYWYLQQQAKEAQSEMFQAVFYFEADSLDRALKGDGDRPGFLGIADDYAMTRPGKLAHYYIGAIYLRQGNYDGAIEHLRDFLSTDILVQARAYALLGDAHSEKGEFGPAADAYRKAANHRPNRFFTPMYLMKLAGVQEAAGDYQAAAKTYTDLIEKYFESQEASEARKLRARAEGLSAVGGPAPAPAAEPAPAPESAAPAEEGTPASPAEAPAN